MSAIRPRGSLLQLPRAIRDETYSHCFSKTYLAFRSYCDQDRTTPGGTLLQLPREIRDEIYSYCFSKAYLVFWSYYDHHDYDEHILTDLTVLRASKVISSDAKHSLFSKAASKSITFKYNIEFDPHEKFSTPPSQEATDRMTKVEFAVYIDPECMASRAQEDGYQDETLYPAFSMEPICEATVDRFAGTAVPRENFRIVFRIDFDDFDDSFPVFMKTRFFQTLKGFTGFQKLTVVLILWLTFSGHLVDLDMDFQKGAKTVQKELEPHLGSSVIKSANYQLSERYYRHADFILELEFQPRKFHVEILRAEAARVTNEVDKIEG